MSNMSISDDGIEFIKREEGFRAFTYKDIVGYATIGYGHKIVQGDGVCGPITPVQGTSLLRSDVKVKEDFINKVVTVPMTQGMFDALCSFTYNLGEGNLQHSTLLRELNSGLDKAVVAKEFLRWDMAGGQHVDGLHQRRNREMALFLS